MEQSNLNLLCLVGGIIGVIIFIVITRAIFSIPIFLRQQKAIIKLLSEIAIKNGVDADTIDGIQNEVTPS